MSSAEATPRHSMRGRLIGLIVAGNALLLVIAAFWLVTWIEGQMGVLFDRALADEVAIFEGLTEWEGGEVEFEFLADSMPEFSDPRDPRYFQLWIEGGAVLRRSPLLRGQDLPRLPGAPGEHRFADVQLPDGRAGRSLQVSFYPRVDEPERAAAAVDPAEIPLVTVMVAREKVSLLQLASNQRMTLGVAVLLLMLTAAWLVSRQVGSALVPLENLLAQLKTIDGRNLATRIRHSGAAAREVYELENQLNALLERLEQAFVREQRFSSDLAHELRTPLAELKLLADVARSRPEDRDTVVGFFADVRAISDQLEHLVVQLLSLARAESGPRSLRSEVFAPREMVAALWRRQPDALTGSIGLDNRLAPDLRLRSDPDRVELILRNLLENAASYSPSGAQVVVDAKRCGGQWCLRVANPAGDLGQADLAHLTERFWRKSDSRSDGGHCGLGLALTEAAAAALGARLAFVLEPSGILVISLYLPAAA